jgi:hypothetical protein
MISVSLSGRASPRARAEQRGMRHAAGAHRRFVLSQSGDDVVTGHGVSHIAGKGRLVQSRGRNIVRRRHHDRCPQVRAASRFSVGGRHIPADFRGFIGVPA